MRMMPTMRECSPQRTGLVAAGGTGGLGLDANAALSPRELPGAIAGDPNREDVRAASHLLVLPAILL